MEKRLILAMVLSFLVIVLYQVLFMKNKPLPETPAQPPAKVQIEEPAKAEPEIKPAREEGASAEAEELFPQVGRARCAQDRDDARGQRFRVHGYGQ